MRPSWADPETSDLDDEYVVWHSPAVTIGDWTLRTARTDALPGHEVAGRGRSILIEGGADDLTPDQARALGAELVLLADEVREP